MNKLPHELLFEKDEVYGDNEKFTKSKAFTLFENLRNKISLFLNKNLDWGKQTTSKNITETGVLSQKIGFWTLNGRRFNYQEFSDGEKVLFTYALLFFLLDVNTETSIKDSIILIDEPELNLHPESEIQLIDAIRKMIGDSGQLWIATHSLNIISSLNYEDIYIVKDGTILDKRNTTPTHAIDELINLNTNLERIKLFLSSIDQWAFANFTVQCFKDPETISTANINDPQFLLFKKALQEYPIIDLLDFGAGTGRVYKTLMEDEALKTKIKYNAFEINPSSIEELKQLGISTIYSSLSQLSSKKYDVILLSNVLHEIGISYWPNTLNQLRESLTEKGFLIILEDLELPKGEQIEEAGFLIMSKEELGLLFNIGEDAVRIELDAIKYKDRISCCIIPKAEAKDVTNYTIKNALEKLMHNCWKNYNTYKIKKTTDPKEQHHYGRKLALYSQLYLNAKRGLELLDEKYKEITAMNEEQKN